MTIREQIYNALNVVDITADIDELSYSILPESYTIGNKPVVTFDVSTENKVKDLTGNVVATDYSLNVIISGKSIDNLIEIAEKISKAINSKFRSPETEGQTEPEWDPDFEWFSMSISWTIYK